MRLWLGMLIAAVLAFSCNGCAPSATVTKERTLSATEVMKRVRERNNKISTLTGDGSITIETPEGSTNGSFDLFLKKPDSLRVELHGPFGIHFGTLMLSRQQFLFYNRMENFAIVGTPDGRTLNSMFRLRLQFDEILRAFSGEFVPPSDTDSLEKSFIENDRYVVLYRTQGGMKEYRVDGDAFIVTSYRMLDSLGKPTITALTSDPEEVGGFMMPKFVRVIFPKERRAVTIAYDGFQLNEPVICAVAVPPKVGVIHR